MATTRSSPVRTTLHLGQSLLGVVWVKLRDLVRERAGRDLPPTAKPKRAPEHEALVEINNTPLVEGDADADAFEDLTGRRSRHVAKPLPIK
jgi:hypothetical protein